MTNQDAVLAVIDALESLDVSYMVVGSLSSNAYGIIRSTRDADFVVQLGSVSIGEVVSRLPPYIRLEPQMSFETVAATTRYLLLIPGSPFKIELFLLSSEEYDQQRFDRRTRKEAMGRVVWLPTPEDVIITKLRWSKQGKRTKDVDDVRNVLAVQGDSLDFSYIHRWCDEHETRQLLEQIRATIPEGL